MTPRALLTVIGATAIAFAIAIGTAAGFSAEGTTSASAPGQLLAVQRVQPVASVTSGTHLARALASSTRDCTIAF